MNSTSSTQQCMKKSNESLSLKISKMVIRKVRDTVLELDRKGKRSKRKSCK